MFYCKALYQIFRLSTWCVCGLILTHLLESVADIADLTPCLKHWFGGPLHPCIPSPGHVRMVVWGQVDGLPTVHHSLVTYCGIHHLNFRHSFLVCMYECNI